MTSFRAAALLGVLALATSNSAFGANFGITSFVQTAASFPDRLEVKQLATSDSFLHDDSEQGNMSTQVFAGSISGSLSNWHISAVAQATSSDDFFNASAQGIIIFNLTDRVFPTVLDGFGNDDPVNYTQHFSISGNTGGSSTNSPDAPALFVAQVGVLVEANGERVFAGSESVNETDGYITQLPRGEQSWVGRATLNGSFDLHVQLSAEAFAAPLFESGSASALADFSNTFRWGEVTDVINLRTGQPIPASDFHLYGEDGFDWAHPPAIPEPSSLVLAGFGLLGLAAWGWRRKR